MRDKWLSVVGGRLLVKWSKAKTQRSEVIGFQFFDLRSLTFDFSFSSLQKVLSCHQTYPPFNMKNRQKYRIPPISRTFFFRYNSSATIRNYYPCVEIGSMQNE